MAFYKIFSALALFSMLLACTGKKKEQVVPVKPVVPVEVIVASTEDIDNMLEVNGSVLANEMAELRPEVSGRLIYLNLPDGTNVKQGTILARVNDAELQAQLEQQKTQ
ncbi:MAG: biotin/lipoyl-binding protein, partial [Candidatus Omnitrophota bacterium]